MRETRIFAVPVEAREGEEGTATIHGYASLFDVSYDVGGQFTESVARSAFNKTLGEFRGQAVVWGHDVNRVLGTVESGSARFDVDHQGLRYEADLDLQDPDGMSAYRKVATGKVRQSSFSFEPIKDRWEERDDGSFHRTLLEVKLYEASPVLWGASPTTSVDMKRAVRSLAHALEIDADADSVPELLALRTTPEPEPEPVENHSEPTRKPDDDWILYH
jgi:uncharacterized protein